MPNVYFLNLSLHLCWAAVYCCHRFLLLVLKWYLNCVENRIARRILSTVNRRICNTIVWVVVFLTYCQFYLGINNGSSVSVDVMFMNELKHFKVYRNLSPLVEYCRLPWVVRGWRQYDIRLVKYRNSIKMRTFPSDWLMFLTVRTFYS